ncbi:MAG: methionyl aminopeptidase [Verrucomicrobia bacterium]|nr:methionyl aminopeptidase [Verrucomicrobiota bacterium]
MIESIHSLYKKMYNILLKNTQQIEKIRHASQVAAKILNLLCREAKAGVTTHYLDILSRELHKMFKATPAPLGYGNPPFPASICTSLNDVICHGIPNDRPLQDGDIINIDVTSIVDGYYGDLSRTLIIGNGSSDAYRVVQASYESLKAAINICKPGAKLSQIGFQIQSVANSLGCSVVHQFVGHGIGCQFHEEPAIYHYANRPRQEIIMQPGMTFTIEPMINLGSSEAIIDKEDHWTARTIDGQLSAQFEHTLLITPTGHEILTLIEPEDADETVPELFIRK